MQKVKHYVMAVLLIASLLPSSSVSANMQVAAGGEHTVGLKADGTVVAVGDNYFGQCDVSGWSGITQVAAGYYHTVGLKADGTVVAVGDNDYGQCDVSGWSGIIQVAAGYFHTVGLKADGNVVAVGANGDGQCDVSGWSGIIQVAAGSYHTVGLKADGTVVAVGWNYSGQCDVSGWSGIIQVAAGSYHTVGLKADGTVLIAFDPCNLFEWDLDESPTLVTLSTFTATPSDRSVLLTWTTASEIENAGFNIYRAEAEDGEYIKINLSVIPAGGSPTNGASYQYIDEDVRNRRTYYYKLEDLDIYGKSTMHGPVSAKPRRIIKN
jgi:alpha-tubulin suppressor-like RCC1 family protein